MTFYGKANLISFGDPKPEKVEKKKVPYRYSKKPTGEREVFEKIWAERPHCCQVTFEPIPGTPTNFAHVLPKGMNKYPKFKLNPQNIILMSEGSHYLWDHNRKAILNDPDWTWVFELEASLKEQYKLLHG